MKYRITTNGLVFRVEVMRGIHWKPLAYDDGLMVDFDTEDGAEEFALEALGNSAKRWREFRIV